MQRLPCDVYKEWIIFLLIHKSFLPKHPKCIKMSFALLWLHLFAICISQNWRSSIFVQKQVLFPKEGVYKRIEQNILATNVERRRSQMLRDCIFVHMMFHRRLPLLAKIRKIPKLYIRDSERASEHTRDSEKSPESAYEIAKDHRESDSRIRFLPLFSMAGETGLWYTYPEL